MYDSRMCSVSCLLPQRKHFYLHSVRLDCPKTNLFIAKWTNEKHLLMQKKSQFSHQGFTSSSPTSLNPSSMLRYFLSPIFFCLLCVFTTKWLSSMMIFNCYILAYSSKQHYHKMRSIKALPHVYVFRIDLNREKWAFFGVAQLAPPV